MPGNSKPRKKYRPKKNLVDPVGFVTESLTPLLEQETYVRDLHLSTHSAMRSLIRGSATKDDMNAILSAHNITQALLVTQKLTDVDQVILKSEAALYALTDRAKVLGRYVLKALELQTLNDMVALHDDFMGVITVGQMEEALKFSKAELKAGRVTRLKTIQL